MGLYLYCIAPAGHVPPPGLEGLDGAAVAGHDAGALTVWVSARGDAPRPSLERVRAHNRVVEAANTEPVTALPLRFGQWVAGAEELRASMREREAEALRQLEQVRGALEFGVRVLDPALSPAPAPAPAVAAGGRAYLEAVAARRAKDVPPGRAAEVAAALGDAIGDVVRAVKTEALPTAHGLFSAAHLVARHDFSRYRERLDDFRGRFPALRVLVSGPWPPYTFVA